MRSKVHFKSHPLHPILVGFPIAFFFGSFFFDILGWARDNQGFTLTAYYIQIVGIGFAVLAAIPGFIDYLTMIPAKSSAKKRGARHGLLNVGALLIFVAIHFLRSHEILSQIQIILLEVAGLALMSIASWMGGTLVHRNQIGIDHRYANAGKWKEYHLGDQSGRVSIPGAGELTVDQMLLIHINGKRIAIGRTESGVVAFDDFCSHRGGPLSDGVMICGTVQCPWHGSQFDCSSGAVKAGPAKEAIKTYTVSHTGDQYFVEL